MLNKLERQKVLKIIGHCCTYGLLPAQVDLTNWELHSRWNWKCHVGLSLFVVNSIYKLATLACSYFLKQAPLNQIILHVTLSIAAPVYIYWYYVLCVEYPQVFQAYLKMTLSGNIGEIPMDDQKQRSWFRRLQECTPQDLFALGMHYLLISSVATIILAFMCYPSLNLLLYAGIPTEYKSWPIFCILLIEDSRFVFNLICIGIPIWTMQVISFELVNTQLQLLMNSIQRAARKRSFELICKSFRLIQLYVGIINLINSFIIFSCKVLYITICIITGYGAIAHFSDYPLFGVMYYLCFLNCAFIYTFGFDKAFKIPSLFEKVTQSALLHMCKNDRSWESKIFRLQIRSIPRVGIKVGDFHMMERESTLIFIHYVFTNIVAMLVTNRHN